VVGTNENPPVNNTPLPIAGVEPLIDRAAGLSYVLGRETAYQKLVAHFRKVVASSNEKIRLDWGKGDFETVQRAVHSVKGMAGTIGAKRLAGCAALFETHLKSISPQDQVNEALLENYLADLEKTISVIDSGEY
jgi:two-component system sensor histidine kinase/response regulator